AEVGFLRNDLYEFALIHPCSPWILDGVVKLTIFAQDREKLKPFGLISVCDRLSLAERFSPSNPSTWFVLKIQPTAPKALSQTHIIRPVKVSKLRFTA
ncbi:MAG: hypothetical protein EBX56_02195, partial [Betaproteobacteria bacterium]|nr:hypothetical protein [Betaproteobacteria bacterium]